MGAAIVSPMHGSAVTDTPTDGIMTDPAQIAYSVPRAAELLDISERQVWSLIASEDLKSFKVGTSRRIARAALLDYVAQRQKAGESAERDPRPSPPPGTPRPPSGPPRA